MSSIKDRAFRPVNLKDFDSYNLPEVHDIMYLNTPNERQYVLRMLIQKCGGEFKIPDEYLWTKPLIDAGYEKQKEMGIYHPYCYLTIRSGRVSSEKDDEWHVDGFSSRITHLPEQSYFWVDRFPTQFTAIPIDFPCDFNPLIHNVHTYIQNILTKCKSSDKYLSVPIQRMFCMDPYVIHRRPPMIQYQSRTFVRVSFVPIEICDDNNTQNPLIQVLPYNKFGLDFRNSLRRYDV